MTISLSSPLWLRDLVRQGTSDLITLLRSLPDMELDADPLTQDLDGSRVHFVSISLGSMLGAPFLGTNTEVATASMSSPYGNFGSLAYNGTTSRYGALLAGLINQGTGLAPGTLGYDEFVRDWQHGLDAIDPLNYAAAAAGHSPIHAMSILNDDALPNSGTDYWAKLAGLEDISTSVANLEGIRGIVRFTDGGHTSLLNPASTVEDLATGEVIQGPNPLVTLEMQQEAVVFALSMGTQLPVNTPLAAAGGALCNCVQ